MPKPTPEFLQNLSVEFQRAMLEFAPWIKLGLNLYGIFVIARQVKQPVKKWFIAFFALSAVVVAIQLSQGWLLPAEVTRGSNVERILFTVQICVVGVETLAQAALLIGMVVLFRDLRRRAFSAKDSLGSRENSKMKPSKTWKITTSYSENLRVDGKRSLTVGPSVKLLQGPDQSLKLEGRFVPPGNALYAITLTLVGLTVFMATFAALGVGYTPGFLVFFLGFRLLRSRRIELDLSQSKSIVLDATRSMVAVKGNYGIEPIYFTFQVKDFAEVEQAIRGQYPSAVQNGSVKSVLIG